MKKISIPARIALLLLLYLLCLLMWDVLQATGIGRPFVYSAF